MFAISCEEVVQNPNLPYKEELVIKAVLENGKPIEDIMIIRTLPPLEEYSMEKSLIKDAEAYISVDGEKHKLIFDNYKLTYYVENLTPQIGKKYSLSVKWKNLSASASTEIPDTVSIESYSVKMEEVEYYDGYKESYFILSAIFKPKYNSVYTGYTYHPNDQYKYFNEYAYRYSDTNKVGRIVLPVNNQYYWYEQPMDTTDFKESMKDYYCLLESYDFQFYKFFITRYNGSSNDDFFGTSGVNIQGNINNGIGLFIGRSSNKSKIFFD
jgi:hypothetical protein